MARPEKEAAVAQLTEKLRASHGMIVTDYRGLAVKPLGDLRRQLRNAGAEYVVVKNTLMRRAADEAGMSAVAPTLEGPTAIVFLAQDAPAAAKAVLAFARQQGMPQVRGVMMGGKLYPAAAAQELASLPAREVMLATVIGAIQGPIAALVGSLQGVLGRLGATLHALAQKRESPAA